MPEDESLGSNQVLLYWLAYIFLLACSSLLSGLTLGIMSLDVVQLKILINTPPKSIGSKMAKYAKAIFPIRVEGSWTLCTLVLGNVFLNSAVAVFSGTLVGEGLTAVLVSTAFIVVFAEIIPQAICSRYGLVIGYYTLPIFKFVRLAVSPIAYPISRILDYLLGDETGTHFDKDQFKALISHHEQELNLFKAKEATIVRGALDFAAKKVEDVMTRMGDVFAISINDTLDYDLLSRIIQAGYSRIPVLGDWRGEERERERRGEEREEREERRDGIVGLVLVKDLVLIDPDAGVTIRQLLSIFQYSIFAVDGDMTLLEVLEQMKERNSHFTVVRKIVQVEDRDPVYSHIGILTMEDLIQELIQDQIQENSHVSIQCGKEGERVENGEKKEGEGEEGSTLVGDIPSNIHIHVKPFLKEIDTQQLQMQRMQRRKKKNYSLQNFAHLPSLFSRDSVEKGEKKGEERSVSHNEKQKKSISQSPTEEIINGHAFESSRSNSLVESKGDIHRDSSSDDHVPLIESMESTVNAQTTNISPLYNSTGSLVMSSTNCAVAPHLSSSGKKLHTAAAVIGRLMLLDKRRVHSELSHGEITALELFLAATQKTFSYQLLPQRYIQQIIVSGFARTVTSGTHLYTINTPCDFASIVLHGSFRILLEDADTEARIGPWQALSCSTALYLPKSVHQLLTHPLVVNNYTKPPALPDTPTTPSQSPSIPPINAQGASFTPANSYLNSAVDSYLITQNFEPSDSYSSLLSASTVSAHLEPSDKSKLSQLVDLALVDLHTAIHDNSKTKPTPHTVECMASSRIFTIKRKTYLSYTLKYLQEIQRDLVNTQAQ